MLLERDRLFLFLGDLDRDFLSDLDLSDLDSEFFCGDFVRYFLFTLSLPSLGDLERDRDVFFFFFFFSGAIRSFNFSIDFSLSVT